MSEQDPDIVRRAHEAWNRDDFEAARALVHPDAEWHTPPDMFVGIEEVHHGHAGFREWWDAAKDPWESFESHLERSLEYGHRVVTVVHLEGVGKASGAKVELHFANVWELDGGQIVRFSAYHSLEEALEAEGLAG